MDNRKTASPPAVGASSLLVIFAVLCLTVFALLSISTVRADERLGDKAAAAVESYYEADCQAELILAQLRAGEMPEGVYRQGNVYSYSCAVSDSQSLAVQVRVNGAEYEVLRWQVIATAQWQAEEALPVWQGN